MSEAATAAALGPAFHTGALYARFAGYVRRALTGVGVAPADADDLTQEVFVILHRRGCTFDDERAARSWLYGAARRIASNHRRARRRAARRDRLASPPGPAPAPDIHLQRIEAASAVERFAATLSPDAQAVFRLSEVEGLSGPDVAGRLGIPLNTAYSHIRRVRSRLKTVAIAAIVLSLLAISMLAGTCHTEARGDRQRVALRPGAHAPG